MSLLQQINLELELIVAQAKQSLVEVVDHRGRNGAGVIWPAHGLVVTNAHIVKGKILNVILADGREYGAKLAALDNDRDLAALVVDARALPAIALGDSTSLQPGQLVIALGHPWGVKAAAAFGIITGGSLQQARFRYQQGLLGVNLALRPGNSGGPLLNAQGSLVGINTIMTGADTGLAIPVNAVKDFLREQLPGIT